jgi:hypothetical protein
LEKRVREQEAIVKDLRQKRDESKASKSSKRAAHGRRARNREEPHGGKAIA